MASISLTTESPKYDEIESEKKEEQNEKEEPSLDITSTSKQPEDNVEEHSNEIPEENEKNLSEIDNISIQSKSKSDYAEDSRETDKHIESKHYYSEYLKIRKNTQMKQLILEEVENLDEELKNSPSQSDIGSEVGDTFKPSKCEDGDIDNYSTVSQPKISKLTVCIKEEVSENTALMETEDIILNAIALNLKRIFGQLPIVRPYKLILRNTNMSIPVILVAPSSLSEISKIVRAAKSLNLFIRCCGNISSFDSAIYVDEYSVLIVTDMLYDTEKISIFKFSKTEQDQSYAVRVLAGVSIREFINFQERNKFNVRTNIEDTMHTVVGSIVAGRHALNSTDPNKRIASLADLVLEIRIVDSQGNLITYKEDGTEDMKQKLKRIVTNLGMLGVVYDVVLAISAYTTTAVENEYVNLSGILNDPNKLIERIKGRYGTQVVYVPFNSVTKNPDSDNPRIWRWNPEQDLVMIRSIDTLPSGDVQDQKTIQLLGELGPEYSVLERPVTTANIMSANFEKIKIDNSIGKVNQNLAWSIHCFSELPYPCNDLTFTIPTNSDGKEIKQTLQIITETMKSKAISHWNYALNVCVRISFTGPSDVAFCPGKVDSENNIFAHIRIIGIRKSDESTRCWEDIAATIGQRIISEIPVAVPQWSTRWSNIEGVDDRILSTFESELPTFQEYMDDMDCDGIFLTNRLRQIFCKKPLDDYRAKYIQTHLTEVARLANLQTTTAEKPPENN